MHRPHILHRPHIAVWAEPVLMHLAPVAPSRLDMAVPGPSGQQVRLVLLPAFARQPTMVLVNLRTLHVRPVTFSMWPVATDA